MDYLKINTNDWPLITGNIYVKRIIATKRNCRRLKKNVLLIRAIRMLRTDHYVELAMLMKMQFCQPFDTTCVVRDE
ncbi:MAG: hypothetical protein ACTS4W_00995 [Candidatus Hodgkinia cicadicola]